MDGFRLFAPELGASNDGMDPSAHHSLDKIQHNSFWFRARNRLISDLARRYFAGANRVLELGCGTGYVLQALKASLPAADLSGSEIYTSGLSYARQRVGLAVHLFQMDARHIPFEAEYDLVCAFDVLEHIDDDERVLRQINRALSSGGGALLSVPQHPFLWSQVDDVSFHKRRYSRNELMDKCRSAGFEVIFSTSFVISLLPAMVVQRLGRSRRRGYQANEEFSLPRWIDHLFEACLDCERYLINLGVRFPIGGSRFVVIKKVAEVS